MTRHELETESGYTALETIICLAVLIQILILGSHYMQQSSEKLVQNNAASHLLNVSRASVYYLQDNMDIIVDQINAKNGNSSTNNSLTIELSELQDKGYLPTNFSNTNIYNQSVMIQVFLLKPDNFEDDEDKIKKLSVLQLLVFTVGGQQLNLTELRNISSFVGGDGGYVYNTEPTLIGSFNSWSLDISNIPDLTAGHNAVLTYINETDILQASNFLRRVKILNKTKYNIMDTDLGIKDEFVLQFIDKENDKIDPLNEDITTIKSKEIRLSKNVYFNDKELIIGNSDNTSKITLSAEGIKVVDETMDVVNIKPKGIYLYNEKYLESEDTLDKDPENVIKNNEGSFHKISKDNDILVSSNNKSYIQIDPLLLSCNDLSNDKNFITEITGGEIDVSTTDYKGSICACFSISPNDLVLADNYDNNYIRLRSSRNNSFNKPGFSNKIPYMLNYYRGDKDPYNEYAFSISTSNLGYLGSNFFGISFSPARERVDVYTNGRYAVLGMSSFRPYYHEGANYTGKPPAYDDHDSIDWEKCDTPYLYLSNILPQGQEKEVLFTPHRVQSSWWYQLHSEERWYKLLKKVRGRYP